MPRANPVSARGLMGELCALTPRSGQMLQAVERSQRDHIEVDQVQLREGQGGDGLQGLFLACAFKHQHHSAVYYGHLDILINNAALGSAAFVADEQIDHFRQLFEVNIFGPLYRGRK